MERENFFIVMEKDIMGHIKKTKKMAMELIIIKMVLDMMETLKMVKNMEME